MIVYPTCKINIGLRILEKRPDGYHNLETVCFPIGWTDILEITPHSEITLICQGLDIPVSASQNLCVKAVQCLQKDYPEQVKGAHIHLYKRIPMGAGLGGGSADAAYTLLALNRLYSLNLSLIKLQKYAEQLGSDVAFFLYRSPQFCYEKGQKMQCISLSIPYPILVIYPGVHSDTKLAYQNVIYQNHKGKSLWYDISSLPVSEWKNYIHNDFERSVGQVYPQILEIKEKMYYYQAIYASMSGSGSAVYGIFANVEGIKKLLQEIPKSYLYHVQIKS
ncbi:MAG: 4-(cytidine 5'-diphospho)-2-C-methyl-D-erythritol kinase [Bacteroidia bacterium]|nr:4-(cytidine 5'-diphospho)-2-C-methyl-D-erythritol kinase [Bacteroidia bacterium]MDW8302249.1 4-(cytidine 5'-diphospho)-2-C-methyl-D-erythritol kinase [Bacteroidia bacterium]